MKKNLVLEWVKAWEGGVHGEACEAGEARHDGQGAVKLFPCRVFISSGTRGVRADLEACWRRCQV